MYILASVKSFSHELNSSERELCCAIVSAHLTLWIQMCALLVYVIYTAAGSDLIKLD